MNRRRTRSGRAATAVYGKWRGRRAGGTNKHGDFSSSFFRTPVRLDQQRRRRRFLPRSGFLMPPRSQIARSPPGLRNPFVGPSVRPSIPPGIGGPYLWESLSAIRWQTMEGGGREGQRGSIILQLNPPNLLTRKLSYLSVWELRAAAAAAGGAANRYDLNVSAASNSWLTSLACLLVVAAAAAVLRRVVPF